MTRWIKIGSVRSDTQLFPQGRGWWLNWRGREDWCQPSQFWQVEHLATAVAVRLRLARLELVAMCSRPPRREYQELWVQVRRFKYGHV